VKIREILHRRTDLSTFVVHLTRDRDGRTARQSLDSIISERILRAATPRGWAEKQDDPKDEDKQSQRVVCFTETPLEHIYSQVADIEGHSIDLAPYGLAPTKLAARKMGINPISYVDMTPGQKKSWALRNAIEQLRDEAIAAGDFHEKPIAQVTPFFDQMGIWPTRDSQKEFWWEREWRLVGDLALSSASMIWLCPEDEMESLFVSERVIDPRWGLEQIIAHLAKFPVEASRRSCPASDHPSKTGRSRRTTSQTTTKAKSLS
jgi:hypothetical protein